MLHLLELRKEGEFHLWPRTGPHIDSCQMIGRRATTDQRKPGGKIAQLAGKIAFLGGKIAAILPPSIPRQSIHPAPSWAPE